MSSEGGTRPTWEVDSVWFRYPGAEFDADAGATLDVSEGELVAILGPNGSGKSTLLRLLVGEWAPRRGRVSFGGRRVVRWAPRDRARRIGVLPQIEQPAFPVTATGLVEMGRYPHLGRWRAPGPGDRRAVSNALERCGVEHLSDREFGTLSGGERQRVRIARALAQEPEALALDEPTASLDVAHEMEIWELLAEERSRGLAVVATTHNLNLASRYADRLVMLSSGGVSAAGSPEEVLTTEVVEQAFEWPVRVFQHEVDGPDEGAPQVVALRKRPVDGPKVTDEKKADVKNPREDG
jgi:iron complex transport system ATP-binding protein